jgi:FkbM family methyltransferase
MKVARAVDRLVSAPLKRAIKGSLLSGHLQRAIKRSEFASELLRLVRPYGHEHFFPLLRQLGFAPRHIVDVGANRGIWTRAAFKYFRDPVYTLVEPQDHLRSYSQDLVAQGCKLNWINAGCGDFCGTLPLTVSYRDEGSTFVDPVRLPWRSVSQRITVPIITLNQIVASSGAGLPEMVKIDAEGFDLKVLAGASNLLGKTDIFLVEAAVRRGPGAYDNSVAEVVRFMAKAGYNLMDITDFNRSPKHGVLWLCELAFLREGSPLLDAATSYE